MRMSELELDPQVITTLREMLQQREYKIDDDVDSDAEDELPTHLIATKPDGKQIVVFTSIVPKYNIKSFHNTVASMNELKIKHGIVVYTTITPATKKKIADTDAIRLTIESFTDQELRYNPTKHRLVPLHTRLNADECKAFKEKYGTKIKVIKVDDVISRFYAFQKGDIIKITRRSGYVDYRIVK